MVRTFLENILKKFSTSLGISIKSYGSAVTRNFFLYKYTPYMHVMQCNLMFTSSLQEISAEL